MSIQHRENQLAVRGVLGLIAVILLVSPAGAAIVFEDNFTGPGGSAEGRSTDGSTAGVNGTYYHANPNLVYTDGVSNLTGVDPATQTGNFGTVAVDVLAGGDLNTTNSIVTATMQINSNRPIDGGNGDEFGTLYVEFEDFGFLGVSHPQSGPSFQFDSLGAPFKLFKPGLNFQTLVSSDTGNGTPAWLEQTNKIEFIYNTSTHAFQLKHNDTLVHSALLDPANATEAIFWNYPTFDNLFFQFNSTNWVVDSLSLDVSRIPEPGTVALLGLGLLVPAFGRRRLRAS
ncbi:PEP-CTERM sorting domain-containing protein [Bythopirellula polymerisocia]|uniref:Ice-binding protein C-terminal domain-containing protein n=1 Tax=Bythopirellula polymerisocia TaxID=2528003 RepID=A0A5C6CTU3_9BACT|nr:PEP-CTERM sorting domain-containing protein [Bythopirellula polymerisocia]TWU28373.1 hypothetical protein Pla144_16610 [Bythopirellula polymerisocia]